MSDSSALVQIVLVQVERRDREAALLACGVRRGALDLEPYAHFLEQGGDGTRQSIDCRLFAEVALAIARARQDGVRAALKVAIAQPGNPAGDLTSKELIQRAAQLLSEGVRDLAGKWRNRAQAADYILDLQDAAHEWEIRITGLTP